MSGIDESHDPARVGWVDGAAGHPDFPVQNLPLGIFAPHGGAPRPGVAIGDFILDLAEIADLLPPRIVATLGGRTLNAVFALPPAERRGLRRRLSALLSAPEHRAAVAPSLHRAADCTMHLPAAIGDYSDFYAGIHHALNVGRQFRPDSPLLANYKYVPIGYHGRASSVRVSDVPVRRPSGQSKAKDAPAPLFGPTRRLDYELELGIWIGGANPLGTRVPIDQAAARIAGLCLLNDWSARDIQAWEYQPLGPFLSKNFHTTISPWVITSEALAPFRVAQPARPAGDPEPLPHLYDPVDQRGGAFAIALEVALSTERMRASGEAPFLLSRGAATDLYWTAAQLVAHHGSSGCDLRPGDLIGTGTISGATGTGLGSLLEISQGGTSLLALPNGETRDFLADGDEIILRGTARAGSFVPIGFGPCRATIQPA